LMAWPGAQRWHDHMAESLKGKGGKRRFRTGLWVLVLSSMFFIGCTNPGRVWLQRRLMFFPSKEIAVTPAGLGLPWEEVRFPAGDLTQLHGWFIRHPQSARVVLICHGNGGNISDRLELCRLLYDLRLSVFAFDYRGFGRSEGTPDEAGTYSDAVGAYDWLRQKGFGEKDILALGESLGGGVASGLATQKQLGGLILQSTFTSMTAVAGEVYPFLPVKWLCTFKYDTLSKLPQIHTPVLVMYGRRDALIRLHHPRELFAAANEPKLLRELPGDHNGALSSDPAVYARAVSDFLRLLE
jgi:pimeloyl-ACP methyl ester carboxylesterase